MASAINFAFYPVISHTLSITDFGDVQVGVSFIMLTAALLTSLSTLALFTTASTNRSENTVGHIERLVVSVSIGAALITSIFAWPLAELLQLQEVSLLYILAFIFVLNIPASTWIGTLQGNNQFVASGWISVASALTKLIAAYVLIQIGWGAHGALMGISIGSFIMLPLSKLFDTSNRLRYKHTFGVFRKNDLLFFKKRLDLIAILISLMLIAFIANIDVLMAKILLAPAEAGAYAQLSTVAKIPYFAGVPIALVLFERYIRRSISQRISLLAFTAIVSIIGSVVIIFADLLLRVIFNYQGIDFKPLVPLTIGFTSYSVLSLNVYLLIAQRRIMRLLILASSAAIAVSALIPLLSSTPLEIADTFMACILVTLLLSLVLTYTKRHE